MNNNVKILIADDEERWRRLVGDFLRNEGFKTVEAANGQEAVELIRQDSEISLAILDIMMPVMDGIQACQTIRGFSQIPIIMLTAKSDEDSEVMGFVCGADEYISKPVKFPVFIARVKALLKRSVTLRSQVEVAGICIDPEAHTHPPGIRAALIRCPKQEHRPVPAADSLCRLEFRLLRRRKNR